MQDWLFWASAIGAGVFVGRILPGFVTTTRHGLVRWCNPFSRDD